MLKVVLFPSVHGPVATVYFHPGSACRSVPRLLPAWGPPDRVPDGICHEPSVKKACNTHSGHILPSRHNGSNQSAGYLRCSRVEHNRQTRGI